MSNQITNYLQNIIPQPSLKSFMQATLGTSQNTNLAVGDHVKFDTVMNSRGTNITLDVTTPYTSTAGVASLGRFTLIGGRTYAIRTIISINMLTGAEFKFRLFNVTTATRIPIGTVCYINGFNSLTVIIPAILIEAVFSPTGNSVIELAINNIVTSGPTLIVAPGFTVFGANDFSGNVITIEEL